MWTYTRLLPSSTTLVRGQKLRGLLKDFLLLRQPLPKQGEVKVVVQYHQDPPSRGLVAGCSRGDPGGRVRVTPDEKEVTLVSSS